MSLSAADVQEGGDGPVQDALGRAAVGGVPRPRYDGLVRIDFNRVQQLFDNLRIEILSKPFLCWAVLCWPILSISQVVREGDSRVGQPGAQQRPARPLQGPRRQLPNGRQEGQVDAGGRQRAQRKVSSGHLISRSRASKDFY